MTGRMTFMNTLCESEVLAHKVSDNPETAHVEENIRIEPANVGVYLLPTRIESPVYYYTSEL